MKACYKAWVKTNAIYTRDKRQETRLKRERLIYKSRNKLSAITMFRWSVGKRLDCGSANRWFKSRKNFYFFIFLLNTKESKFEHFYIVLYILFQHSYEKFDLKVLFSCKPQKFLLRFLVDCLKVRQVNLDRATSHVSISCNPKNFGCLKRPGSWIPAN